MQLTDEQNEIVQFVKSHPNVSLVQNALAGTGKTSTMVVTANELPSLETIAACAFNKDIAKTLGDKLPFNCESRTINAFCHRACMKGIPRKLDVKAYKCRKLLEDTMRLEFDDYPDVVRLVGLAKAYGIVPDYPDLSLVPDEVGEWTQLAEMHNLYIRDGDVNVARDLLRLSTKVGLKSGFIDFDDQIYLSAIFFPEYLPTFDTVFVDEAQDVSAMNRGALYHMVGGRIIAVGDRHQAIYAFRGGDYTSIDKIKTTWDAHELPLTICFRCSKEVIREAQRIVPAIRWAKDAIEGSVERQASWSPKDLPAGSSILCRNVAPLIRTAFSFIRAGIAVQVRGRDIGKGLTTLIKKLKVPKGASRDLVLDALDIYYVNQSNYLGGGRDKEQQLTMLEDKVESIRALIGGLTQTAKVEQICEGIERLFEDNPVGRVTLSSIHKAKGLEWDTVHFLDEFLIPSRYATSPEQIQQESNLRYVAITRARKDLRYIYTTGRIS